MFLAGKRCGPFILQKAFPVQSGSMQRLAFIIMLAAIAATAGFTPQAAYAADSDQAENTNCSCKTPRRTIVRPLTESTPIRKSDKVRIRRILM
jgi:hypothetical protein